MKKTKFLVALTGIISVAPVCSDAAYPVYNQQQMARQGYVINNYQPQYNPQQMAGRTNITTQQLSVAANGGRPMVATNPNRITGSLPRVGSSATTAGRQYYQSSDYDRLADSGLYIGLSAGYSVALNGSMSADYAGEDRP